MHYLYIRIVKAKDLFGDDNVPAYDPYVEARLGNYRALTTVAEKKPNPGWNQVFAFSKDRIYSPCIEFLLRNKDPDGDGVKGRLFLDVNEVPRRVPPDSPLAPQWYKLEGGDTMKGELMLAVWIGTQADEAFTEAWHSDAAGVSGESIASTKSKVYLSPKLWYLRINVIQAQDLEIKNRNRRPEIFVRAVFGTMISRTKVSLSKNVNPMWNEDLMFVAAEPFENPLVLTVEDGISNNKEEVHGKCVLHVGKLERRLSDNPVDPRWFSLETPVVSEGGEGKNNEPRFNSKIQLRASLDGGYHVLDETTHHSSDLRPTVRQLWKQRIGVLELGILNATGLPPMKKKDGQGRTDAYCVAKYGQKWVRTRTIVDSCSPQWNEQYTWEVFDPCTMITVGVFDNCHLQESNGGGAQDSKIGKLRIRLSTLEINKIYTHSYPLLVLHSQGLKKMGEVQLAIRFSCPSIFNLLQLYTQPILPRMHYTHPLSLYQQDCLRYQATQLLTTRLGRSEPPLRKEVVEYMLNYGSNLWSKRRTTANCQRIKAAFSSLEHLSQGIGLICSWKKPFLTVTIHFMLLFLIFFPELIVPTICFYLFLIGILNYRSRIRDPPHMDPQLSCIERLTQDDLDEEFDGIPSTCKNNEALKFRYNRLRVAAGQVQSLLGDLATQMERLHSLLNWRDPRATALFVSFCLVAGIFVYLIRLRTMIIVFVLYILRHPRFKSKLPSAPVSFFRIIFCFDATLLDFGKWAFSVAAHA
ncbi:hypothetical protein Cgig2_003523 [Carnegiea gigantea]|uniref:C2 domain-containing protein n=1 Tax=Carnegiea gigantea TaxID=171969 RepID=A0A9Q1GTJ0_9CARY|nr:hypothetical protein Cgig2_003523 [Carnegiea gigantea]